MNKFASTVLLTGFLATLVSPAVQAETAHRPVASGLSRAEVIADTRLWVRAGADRYSELAQYHSYNVEYEHAVAEYRRLRAGPAYAEEVAKVEGERGEARTTRLSQQ